jgi:hypothetical protein
VITENLPPDDALSKFKYDPYDIVPRKSTAGAVAPKEVGTSVQINISAGESLEDAQEIIFKDRGSTIDVSKMIQEAKEKDAAVEESKRQSRSHQIHRSFREVH